MPEYRFDPPAGRWVVVAAERGARPHTFESLPPIPEKPTSDCPFCPGNEHETPPEVFRTGNDGTNWRIRVFPNKFPIVAPPDNTVNELSKDIWRQARPAQGVHEVAVMSPSHNRSLALLSEDAAIELFQVMRSRVATLLESGLEYVQTLVNHGKAAGASIEHPHTQLIGIDFIPDVIANELRHDVKAGSSLIRTSRDYERGGLLSVIENENVVAWCPWASANPFEVTIAPVRNNPRFEQAEENELAAMALATRDVLVRLHAVVGEQPYNLIWHSAPRSHQGDYQWHIRLQPRMSVVAGFELGAGVFVNIVPPEQAAKLLREGPPPEGT